MNLLKEIFYFFCDPCRPNTSATVRYAFPIFFALAALMGTAAVISSNSSYIHIESSHTALRSGETFQIEVYAYAHVAVNAVDIKLEFPKEQIKILGIDTGESVITLWTHQPHVENNAVVLSGGTFRRGFKGDHLIATINAQAIETGLAQIDIGEVMLLSGDGTGNTVSVADTEEDTATLFITDADSLALDETGTSLQGTASIVIITDIDGDGIVTLSDITRFMAAWANKNVTYDFNGDGKMSFRDFGIILADSFFR